MKAYLLTLTGAILISAVLSILVSDGKMGKFIKGMIKLFVFSVVILPLSVFFGQKNFSFSLSEVKTDDGYLKKCSALLSHQDEAEIKKYLKEEYEIEADVIVERSYEANFPREKISLKIKDDGIFQTEEHIDMMNWIQAFLEENYNCETEVVWQEKA